MLLQHPHQHTQNKTKQHHTTCACLCACARAHTHLTPHFRGCKHPSPPTDHTHPHANIHTWVGAGAGYVAAGGRGCCCGCVCSVCTRCIAVRGLCGRPCAALGGHVMSCQMGQMPRLWHVRPHDACDACPSCMFESLIIITWHDNAWACITGGQSVELGQDDGRAKCGRESHEPRRTTTGATRCASTVCEVCDERFLTASGKTVCMSCR